MWNKLKSIWAYVYLRYALATGVNEYEPWEANLINGMIILTIALVSYSSCVYLPQYLMTLMSYLGVIIDNEKLVVDYPSYTSSQM